MTKTKFKTEVPIVENPFNFHFEKATELKAQATSKKEYLNKNSDVEL